jgi:hypothetical protein
MEPDHLVLDLSWHVRPDVSRTLPRPTPRDRDNSERRVLLALEAACRAYSAGESVKIRFAGRLVADGGEDGVERRGVSRGWDGRECAGHTLD